MNSGSQPRQSLFIDRFLRAAPVIVGIVLAGLVFLVIRKVHIAVFHHDHMFNGWANGLCVAVAGVGLALVLVQHTQLFSSLKLPARLATMLAAGLATLSIFGYTNLGEAARGYPFHRWDQFHYYVGAKYFRELEYERLYVCVAVAEAERDGPWVLDRRKYRDLKTTELVPASHALARTQECKARFTAARWELFKHDVGWFRDISEDSYWNKIQEDHGYNPPPGWTITGNLIGNATTAGEKTALWLGRIDLGLIAASFALVFWAFGSRVLWIAMVLWGCQVPGNALWTFGAFLRQDWLFFTVASVCFAKKRAFGWSGAAIAIASALRVFPVFLLVVPALMGVRTLLRTRAIPREFKRFTIGAVLGGGLMLTGSLAMFGPSAYSAFARHMKAHRNTPLTNHVGLPSMLSSTWQYRVETTHDPKLEDPFHLFKQKRRETLEARKPLWIALGLLALAVAAIAAGKIRRLWVALALSSTFVFFAVDLTCYYYNFYLLLGVLAAANIEFAILGLAMVLVSRILNGLPIIAKFGDVRYVAQSVVFLFWSFGVLALWPWTTRFRATKTNQSVL